MARFIDAENARIDLDKRGCYLFPSIHDIDDVQSWLDEQPTADVAPVIHAKWVRGKIGYSCSNCLSGDDFVDPSTCYCPSCGAKMDLDAIGTVEYEKGDNE